MIRIAFVAAVLGMGTVVVLAAEPDRPGEKLPTMKLRIPESTVEYEMVKLPAGKIELPPAKEGEAPRVVEVKSLWVGKLEVSWDCYAWWAYGRGIPASQRFAGVDAKTLPSVPYRDVAEGWGHDTQPAIRMTLQAAQKYCDWLSKQTGKKVRLPTEAEWEYACRAGGPPMKDMAEKELGAVAWYEANSEEKAHPGGQKKPNAWGLYDTLGNVAEWVQPEADKSFTKGGAWNSPAKKVDSSGRAYFKDAWQNTDPEFPKSIWWLSDGAFVGMRLVVEE